MSPCSIFQNIKWKFSAIDQFSEHHLSPQNQTKIVEIAIQLLYFNLIISHDLKFLLKCENLFPKVFTIYCMIYILVIPLKHDFVF